MKSMVINATSGIGGNYESMKSAVASTQENVGADSVLTSMKKMVPNWNFATNTQAQSNDEVRKAVSEPEKIELDTDVVVQAKEPDGSWLV